MANSKMMAMRARSFFEDNGSPLCFGNINDVAEWALDPISGGVPVERVLVDFHRAEQEELDVVARPCLVERRVQCLAGNGRPNQMNRDDHNEVGLVLLERRGAEQRTKHRDLANTRQLLNVFDVVGLQQAGNGKALAIAK